METKHSYKSKGIVGGALAAFVSLSLLAKMFWPEVIDDETIEQAKDPATIEAIMLLVSFGSGLLAVWGRWTARKAIVPMLLIGVMILGLAGCNDPLFNAHDRASIKSQSLIITEYNNRCQAGDDAECREGLQQAADTLSTLVEGM